jgi:diguanylate cyclase (GGDEF)-like protein/PAS domain S-box-containing protein
MKEKLLSVNNRLARRMSIYVILTSTLIAIFTSGIQIYSEFQREVKGVYADLKQIEQTHLSNISSQVWVLNVKELETSLNSLLSLPSIQYIAAYDNETLFMEVGSDTNHKVIIKDFPLQYEHNNKQVHIGKLIVKASLDQAYQHIIDRAIIIISINAIKTFIVAFLILLIFYHLVAQHLIQITRFAEQLDIDTLNKTFEYNRKKSPPAEQDELDVLKTALSTMQYNLAVATQDLRDREQNLATTLDSIGDAVISTNAKGIVTRINPVAEQLTGWSLEEAMGQPLISIFPIIDASTRESMENPIEKVITTAEVVHLSNHTTLISKDGTEYQIADSAAPIRDENGNIQGMVLVFNDITERYQLREAAAKSRRDLQAIMDHTPAVIYVKDTEGRFTFINKQFEKLFHLQTEDIIGKTLHDIFPKDIADEMKRNDKAVWEKGHALESEETAPHDDGLHTYISIKFPLFNEGDKIYAICGVSTDITERKRANIRISRFSRIFEDSLNEIYLFDKETLKFVEVNRIAQDNLGYSMEELMEMTPVDIKPELTFDEFTEMLNPLYLDEQRMFVFETTHERKDKSLYSVEVHLQLHKYGDEELFVAMVMDITDRKQAEDELSFQASHDALTGLVNRREFEQRVERLLLTVKKGMSEHALCFMDLDQFKVVNDTCGHTAGDEMLRQLSSLLLKTVRHRDTLARLGGDEFGVLMEHCSLDDAHRVATSLQKAIQNYQFLWEEHSFKVGVSMGLVPITETTTNITELLKDADAACYMAKDSGRNRIHVHHTEDIEMAQRHGEMQWVTRIQQALEKDRFCLYAQSIVPLDGGTDIHYELLVRMVDEKGKIVPPGAFLPAAERYNLITNIDRWVIDKTLALLEAKPAFMERIDFISINLSGQSLADINFQQFVINKFMKSGFALEKFCFEITETAAISNLNTANLFITKMKVLGCQFALDDFGSGLSSFGYLKNMEVDYLKIDGMFVRDIADDPIDHAMVKSINEIGQVMGMRTIAEFVENDIIKGMLKEIGVNYAQGYGIHKPQSFEELLSRPEMRPI